MIRSVLLCPPYPSNVHSTYPSSMNALDSTSSESNEMIGVHSNVDLVADLEVVVAR
jgi:hypothetical protein